MQCISIRIGFLHVLKTKKKNRQYEFDQGEKFNDVIFFQGDCKTSIRYIFSATYTLIF